MRRDAVVSLSSCCALAVLLSGCWMARTYHDHPLDEHKIATIERGVTTKAEVLERLGPPQEVDAREITTVNLSADPFEPPPERIVAARYFRYSYERGNGFAIITLILFNYLEFDQKSDSLVIFFDDDNKVQDYAFVKDTDLLPRYGFWSR